VNVQLGLINVGFNDYVQAVVQNMSQEIITLRQGTAVAQLLLIKAKLPTFVDNQASKDFQPDSFGSTSKEFQNTLKDSYSLAKGEPFTAHETDLVFQPLFDVEDRLGPNKISVNFIPIHLLDDARSRALQTFDLQEFENSLIEKISPNIVATLPTVQEHAFEPLMVNNARTEEEKGKEKPHLNEDELSLLLAADIATNKNSASRRSFTCKQWIL